MKSKPSPPRLQPLRPYMLPLSINTVLEFAQRREIHLATSFHHGLTRKDGAAAGQHLQIMYCSKSTTSETTTISVRPALSLYRLKTMN